MNIKTIIGILLLIVMVPVFGSPNIRIVFVQVPYVPGVQANGNLDVYVEGSRIVSFTDGEKEPRVLTHGFWSACDPAVSFDGKRILFAGKREQGDYWQIWRMALDGGNKKPITHIEADCISPIYAGTLFHLNDKLPTRQLAYMRAGHIYTCEMDGANERRITYGSALQAGLDVLPNGRILFSRDKTIYSVNIDGTDLMGYVTGFDLPGIKQKVRVGDDGFIYFVGDGGLVRVKMHRPARSARSIPGNYHSPCPLPDGSIIISQRTGSLYSLVFTSKNFLLRFFQKATNSQLAQTQTPNNKTIYKSNDYHSIDAQVLTPHRPVRGRSSFVAHKQTSGVLYCLNVYISRSELKHGTVKQVRVKTKDGLLGVAPVEVDGSFHIRVPARTPLTFSLLDTHGKTLIRQKTPTWVMPRESRGCIGCHEDPELAPPNNKLAEALTKPAVDLTIKKEEQK